MTRLAHVQLVIGPEQFEYLYPGEGGRPAISLPERPGRKVHSESLKQQLETAQSTKQEVAASQPNLETEFTVLEFRSEANFELKLESLERRQKGIELISVRYEDTVMIALVRVPDVHIGEFIKLLEQYANDDTDSGRPVNQALIESISQIRLAAIYAFWTDDPARWPPVDNAIWWEVWLSGSGDSGVIEQFQVAAREAGLKIGRRLIRFPERLVLVAFGTREQLSLVKGLFEYLAELRRAIEVPTAYIDLPTRDQALVVEDAVGRTDWPASSAPAICLLDTGVNREHPMLAKALSLEHTQKVDPEWSSADLDGHGTGMAGLALYGCLTDVFNTSDRIVLSHRLESVKILPDHGDNHPENYGAITSEAVALAETVSPTRKRTICIAVSANRSDNGIPSSWSAEIDQLCAGVHDDQKRLVILAAGNIRGDLRRNDYPSANHLEGVEEPGQAWNALTIGAYTDKAHITSEEFDSLAPIAPKGRLCPTSRTSVTWTETDWPYKPDLVFEGGNTACVEAGIGSFIEDLVLLTTRVSASGAQFTHFCETSAATALAARMAVSIQCQYENYWPETVRALMVHSAEWTPEMLDEFSYEERVNRLKVYGYGVPNLERALYSASNVVTLVGQYSLQPFRKVGSEYKTNEINFHNLPWPEDVLAGLGDTPISMRVTLSYFIDPSPGRRGWGYKHGYRSFGLRFDVKRPYESESRFKQRLNKKFWDDPTIRPQNTRDTREWDLGDQLRTRGSVHSDRWRGTAAELAACGLIAVFPVIGWWRERPHLQRWANAARYALIVTIETPEQSIDLYTPVAALVEAEVRAATESTIEIDLAEDDFI
jgi:hypothetical protein